MGLLIHVSQSAGRPVGAAAVHRIESRLPTVTSTSLALLVAPIARTLLTRPSANRPTDPEELRVNMNIDRKMSEQKLNIEFVKEVEHYPCIYDYRRMDYARKEVIDKAWAKIGTKFNLSGPQCKERWKNLRTVLSRNLKPNERNGRSRSSKQQRKPYYLFEAMKFAVPFIKSHNTVPAYFRPKELSNSASDQDDKSEEVEDNEEEMPQAICHVKVENVNYDQSRSPSPQYVSPPPSPQVNLLEAPSPMSVTPPPAPRRSTRKRKIRRQSNYSAEIEMDENVTRNIKPTKSKTQNRAKVDLTKISKKRFLLSLLSDVYSMNDMQMRSFRIKILNLINEITQTPSSPLCEQCGNAASSSQSPEQSYQSQIFKQEPEQSSQSPTFSEGPVQLCETLNLKEPPNPTVLVVKVEKGE